jgi:hypothetical protein
MKNFGHRGLIIVALLTAALAQAGCSKSSSSAGPNDGIPVSGKLKGPSGVPAIKDGVSPSADRVTMDQAIARAAQEHKQIILEVGAAWCGPCNEFAADMDSNPDYLKDLSANGYILVKAEFEKMVTGGGLDFLTLGDFMPAFIGFFPSFYIYSNGAWTGIGTLSSFSELKSKLEGNIQPMTVAEIKAAVQNQKSSPQTQTRVYSSIMGNFVGVYTYSEAKEIMNVLESSNNKNAGYSSLGNFMRSYISEYVGVKALTAQQLGKDFPDVGATLTDASNEGFNVQPFYFQLESSWRTVGLKQTSNRCAAEWQAYRKQIQPGKLSVEDFNATLAKLDSVVEVTCAHLEWRVGGVTPALKDKVAKIDKARNKDWALLTAVGEVDRAVEIFHTHYQLYADEYAKSLAQDQTDLDAAKAGGDAEQIKQAQHALDIDTFRAKHHAELDTDVEADLRCGVSEQHALTILN